MKIWKQAFSLAILEWKQSILTYVLLLMMVGFFTFVFLTAPDINPLNNRYAYGYDFYFLILAILPPMFILKPLKVRPIKDDLWAAPSVYALLSLPITKDVIGKSRILIHYGYGLFFQILILIMLYITSRKIQHDLPGLEFVAFSLMILAFGLIVISIFATADIGDRTTPKRILIWSLVVYGIVIIGYILFVLLSDYALFHWFMKLSILAPIWTSIGSLFIIFATPHYAHKYILKKLKRIDYL